MDTKMFWSRRRWISFEAAVSGTVVLLVIWSENDIGQRILRIIGREPDRRDNSFKQCRTPLLTWALFISSSSTNASPSLMWLPARLIRSSLVWIFHYSQVSAWAPFGSSFNVDRHSSAWQPALAWFSGNTAPYSDRSYHSAAQVHGFLPSLPLVLTMG